VHVVLDHAVGVLVLTGDTAQGNPRFRFFLGVEVVESAEKLVEAVVGRQVLVAVDEAR